MSFNYGNKSRHRTSGKHFKLFSDELPRIEFDKASLVEYDQTVKDKRRVKGRRKTFRDANHDRFSLPSLGTPEWDLLSDTEKGRPQSYSPFNPLNPNFAKIHQKVQRRHTLRETKSNDWNGLEENLRIESNSYDKSQYTNAWHEKIRKSKLEKDLENSSINEKDSENINGVLEPLHKITFDKPPIPKKKSVFRELLDASAKENVRMSRIKEGLKFKDNNSDRHTSVASYRMANNNVVKSNDVYHGHKTSNKEENTVPEVISVQNGNTKPGILKHGVRIRESNIIRSSSTRKSPVKPRLIHQEDLPLFGHDGLNKAVSPSDEVRVSVYADTPLNRTNDMMFVPLPSTKPKDKQKRVNFDEHIDIKERTAVSELLEAEDENELSSESDLSKIHDSEKENDKMHHKDKSVQIRRRGNVRHSEAAKSLHDHTETIKHMPLSNDARSGDAKNIQRFNRSKDIVGDKNTQNFIDSILLSSKQTAYKSNDVQSKASWKEARPAVSEVLIHEPDPVDIIAIANSPIDITSSVAEKLQNDGSKHKHQTQIHQLVYSFTESHNLSNQVFQKTLPQSPAKSPPRSPPRSPDIDTISEFTTYFDDELNFDDLPDEIDRSMLGEDLIKAYRLWDRKRKAFPGGLRKIDAPADRHDSLYPKQYGSVKTYKITNSKLEKQPISHSGTYHKPSQSSMLMDWV